MPKSTSEQLDEVQAAISAVCAGKSVMFEGHSVTLENLHDLEAREEKLLNRYYREKGVGGMAVNVGIPRR